MGNSGSGFWGFLAPLLLKMTQSQQQQGSPLNGIVDALMGQKGQPQEQEQQIQQPNNRFDMNWGGGY